MTGHPYPDNSGITVNTSAYADYRTRQGTHQPFNAADYGGTGNFNGNIATTAQLTQYGTERRLVAAPVIDCSGPTSVTIGSMACILMLNPMTNGANGTIYLEYRGLATAANSPCRTGGLAGGPASAGPMVPTLVQ
jgi:hypothetical protein